MKHLREMQDQFLKKLARLEHIEAQWHSAIVNAPMLVAIVDLGGVVQFLNHPHAGVSVEDAVGKKLCDLVHPQCCDLVRENLQQVLQTGETRSFESAGRDGQDAWYEMHLGPVKTGDQVVAATVIILDITERKRADEALRRARVELERRVEERTAELLAANEQLSIFRKLAEASEQGFGIADLQGCITYVNPALCRIMGETRPEDVVGQSFLTYVAEESQQRQRTEYVPTMLREGRWLQEGKLLTRQGTVTPIFNSSFLIRDDEGNPAYLATIIIDISKRKAAEEALRQSEEKYRGLLEACPDAVVMGDLSGKALFASRQTWRLLGIPESVPLVGRSVYEFVTEDDQRRSAENLPHLTEAGAIAPTEYTALRQDGTTVPVEISAAISRDAEGCPVAFMAVIRDTTERKRAEEALRQSRDKLQKEHRTLKHLLQSSDHERQLIAYEIHDGLAQQLAGAIMQLQTFQHLKETKPKDAAKALDAGVTMLQQGHFEARRLISGVRPPILDEEGVVAAVAHLVNEQRRLKGPKIEYRNSVDFDRLAPILENGIYRIAQEGLANACQHSGSEKVRVMLRQRDDRVLIEIRDWGVGFDVGAIQENRFGLVGIRQRARLLGGKCSIRSTPGKGTRVSVELPVVSRE